mmetsp:Transcript_41700/g.132635  ORF Transcript_41700/g.132635 Transcript_41700/m.132635 type:complete len:114 (+) Transcript_41700:627-968(+)
MLQLLFNFVRPSAFCVHNRAAIPYECCHVTAPGLRKQPITTLPLFNREGQHFSWFANWRQLCRRGHVKKAVVMPFWWDGFKPQAAPKHVGDRCCPPMIAFAYYLSVECFSKCV